jgi:hypothetical protein
MSVEVENTGIELERDVIIMISFMMVISRKGIP